MSLRSRVALLVAVTVLIASTVGGLGVALSSRRVGIDRLDQELQEDASRFDANNPSLSVQLQINVGTRRSTCNPEDTADADTAVANLDTEVPQAAPPIRERPNGRGERLGTMVPEFASVMQVVRTNGIALPGCLDLPVDEAERAIARSGAGSELRTVSIEDTRYRMLTVGLGDVGALQLARDLDLTEGTLRGLFTRIIGFGAVGALLAGLIGWYFAGRATRPVERLSAAADRVARTRDLGERIQVEGTDEISALATNFNTMLESLDTSREQQQRLVQDASHELRTPLTSMRTNVELLQRHTNVPDDVRAQVMADIGDELAELSELAAELVESATEVRTDPDHDTPFDLADVVAECVDRGRRRHRREIDLELGDAEESVVVGDPALVTRALTNLINNAAKFTDDDTAISVVSHGTSVRVLDRGSGIDPADLPRIFDRFYRATAARTAPGSGLGLAIVKQIVEGHGGSLHVANRPEGGLEIGFSLPATHPTGTT